jgi:hypothetical protein
MKFFSDLLTEKPSNGVGGGSNKGQEGSVMLDPL